MDKKSKIIIILLVLIILGLITFLVVDKAIVKNSEQKNGDKVSSTSATNSTNESTDNNTTIGDNEGIDITNTQENSDEQNTLKEDKDKEYVYDAEYESNVSKESYKIGNRTLYLKDIKVPYINIKSDDAEKANKEIEDVYKQAIEQYNKGISDETSYVDECSYHYYINDNVLSIVIRWAFGATSVPEDDYYTCNFDLKTGKKLEYSEVYKNAGFDSSNIDSKVESAINTKMKEKFKDMKDENYPEGTNFDTYDKESKDNYKKDVKNNTLKYFLSEDGKLNVVVELSIPAGRGEFPTIIEIYK